MATVAEFPELIEDLFITKEKNDAGIYKLRFFIRGKPWVVSVDDEMLFNEKEDQLHFAMIGESKNIWAPLVEKAFAKMKGNYATASDGGFISTGLRSIVGCPIQEYLNAN